MYVCMHACIYVCTYVCMIVEKKLAQEEEERLLKIEDDARIAKGKKPKKRKPKVEEVQKKVIEDEIDGITGVEVIFDNAKMMFILSDRSEDMLIMSLKLNEAATYRIHHSYVRVGTYIHTYIHTYIYIHAYMK